MKKTVYASNQQARLHLTRSNSKLGGKKEKIFALSYVPGAGIIYFKDGRPVSTVVGTCGAVDCSKCGKKGICYAIDSFVQYPAVTVACVENTLQLREDIDTHFNEIYAAAIKEKVTTIRYTASGEIENYRHFEKVVELAERLPAVNIYLYTKNYKVLREFFGRGLELPNNLVVLISVWGDQGVKEYNEFKHHNNIKCFAVNSTMKTQATCPAYTLVNGKAKLNKEMTCAKCGLCTARSKAKIIGCIEH